MSLLATKKMSATEFYDWVQRADNRDKSFELERGQVIEMPPPGKFHGFVCANVSRLLGNFAAARNRGYVCTNDAGILVETDPDTVRGPDVTFYEDAQNAETMDRQFSRNPPRLAVEILSPNDRPNRTMLRINQMLARGVELIWVVDPEARDVLVHRRGQEPYLCEENDELGGEDVLADFSCLVQDFFRIPGQPSPS